MLFNVTVRSRCDNMPRSPPLVIDHTFCVTLTSAGHQRNNTKKLHIYIKSHPAESQMFVYLQGLLVDDCCSSSIDYPQVLIVASH